MNDAGGEAGGSEGCTIKMISLNPEESALPLGHLQLEARARTAAAVEGIRTVGDLLNAIDHTDGWTPTARGDARAAFEALATATAPDGRVDWDRFRTTRPAQVDCIFFTSAPLRRLSAVVRVASPSIMHFDTRAMNCLQAAHINNVGELVEAARTGIAKLAKAGKETLAEIDSALTALSKNVGPEGEIEWISYARERGFAVIPEKAQASYTGCDFLMQIAGVAERAVTAECGVDGWQIFRKRILSRASEYRTLEEMGSIFKLTRERVRQIEEQSLEMLRGVAFADDYRGCEFRLRSEFLDPLRTLANTIASYDAPVLQFSEWESVLADVWGVASGESVEAEQLIPALLGLRLVAFKVQGLQPLLAREAEDRKGLRERVEAIHRVLTTGKSEGLDDVDLLLALKKELRDKAPALAELPALVRCCSSIESVKADGRYRAYLHVLSRCDQAERLLREAGTALDFREICRRINQATAGESRELNAENLKNQMVEDERFTPVGRTGEWALAAWSHVETRTVTDFAADLLRICGKPIGEQELFTKISARRRVARSSLGTVLDGDERFRKAGHRMWSLATWKVHDDDAGWNRDRMIEFLRKAFADEQAERLEFRDLRKRVMAAAGCDWRTAKSLIEASGIVRVEKGKNTERFANLNKEPVEPAFGRGRRERVSVVSEEVAGHIRAILLAHPEREMLLAELVGELRKKHGHPKPRIYWVIENHVEFQKTTILETGAKLCRLVNEKLGEFSQVARFTSPADRAETRRAVENLTIDDSDVALSLLAKLFEARVKSFLNAVQCAGTYPVDPKTDFTNLSKMIAWMVKHRFITDRETAELLRVERNARMHGEVPSLEERRTLFAMAPYLARVYLDYLLLLQDRLPEATRAKV